MGWMVFNELIIDLRLWTSVRLRVFMTSTSVRMRILITSTAVRRACIYDLRACVYADIDGFIDRPGLYSSTG